jgi:hypothetical protein
MSLAALNYMMELEEFPDGTPLNATHKVVGLVLANAHNGHTRLCWPSIELISRKARLSPRTVQRMLQEMETHGIIRRIRPDRQGRTHITEYVFPTLPPVDQSAPKKLKEGRQGGTLSPMVSAVSGNQEAYQGDTLIAERATEGCHPRQERVTEGCPPRLPYKEEPGTVLTGNHSAPVGQDDSCEFDLAQDVIKELALVGSRDLIEVIRLSIPVLAKVEELTLLQAHAVLLERARVAAAGGITLNRFWFADRKFLQTKKRAGPVLSPGEILRQQLKQDRYQ